MRPVVVVTRSEVFNLAQQIAAHPPDDRVTLCNAADGAMRAEWTYKDRPVRIGLAGLPREAEYRRKATRRLYTPGTAVTPTRATAPRRPQPQR